MCLSDKTVLSVGLNGKTTALRALPIQLISAVRGRDAIRHLREHLSLNAMVSTWDLPDMSDGALMRRIRAARPWLPTVVLMDEPFLLREAAARRLGITALLPDDVDNRLLQRTVAAVLGLDTPTGSGQQAPSNLHQRKTEDGLYCSLEGLAGWLIAKGAGPSSPVEENQCCNRRHAADRSRCEQKG